MQLWDLAFPLRCGRGARAVDGASGRSPLCRCGRLLGGANPENPKNTLISCRKNTPISCRKNTLISCLQRTVVTVALTLEQAWQPAPPPSTGPEPRTHTCMDSRQRPAHASCNSVMLHTAFTANSESYKNAVRTSRFVRGGACSDVWQRCRMGTAASYRHRKKASFGKGPCLCHKWTRASAHLEARVQRLVGGRRGAAHLLRRQLCRRAHNPPNLQEPGTRAEAAWLSHGCVIPVRSFGSISMFTSASSRLYTCRQRALRACTPYISHFPCNK